jgi:ectoine hydroxylase-related dioxygenase (phytanoyl-CoA dioxygenase family)
MDVARPYGTTGGDDLFTQALFPEIRIPALRDTLYVRNGRRIAAKLLGEPEGALVHWGHMLRKPARIGYEAPWHQDEAYWDPALDYQAVGAWLPLEDAVVENGCLWFIPGSHKGDVLEHRHVGDDPSVHILELVHPADTSTALPVPTKAGGATFHHPRTLHHSDPNTTDGDRRAYANEFQAVPVTREAPADRSWVAEGRAEFDRTQTAGDR